MTESLISIKFTDYPLPALVSSLRILHMELIKPEEIKEASEYIRAYVRRTPLEESAALSSISGTNCFLKLENLQKIHGDKNGKTLGLK